MEYAELLETFAAGLFVNDWRFMYIERMDAIRAYNKHGVTIMTAPLSPYTDAQQAELFDLLSPVL